MATTYIRFCFAAALVTFVAAAPRSSGPVPGAPVSQSNQSPKAQARRDGARFSFTMNGKTVSNTLTNDLVNAVFREKKPGVIKFTLLALAEKGPMQPPGAPALSFTVPDHGTTRIEGRLGNAYGVTLSTNDDAGYLLEAMTVAITENTASHVVGTFSGTFNGSSKVTIANGTFDLPYSTQSAK